MLIQLNEPGLEALVEIVCVVSDRWGPQRPVSMLGCARDTPRASENGLYFRTTAFAIAPGTGNHHRAVKSSGRRLASCLP